MKTDINPLPAILKYLFRLFFISILIFNSQMVMADEVTPVRFGILSIAQPSRIFSKWQPFANYMSEQLGRPVELVVPRGFGKMQKTIANGDVDFFYINSHVFYRLKQAGKAVGVAQMQNIRGSTTSRSKIFVKSDSGINTVADLKGKKIAYVSPMGAGGYLAPRAHLYGSGLKGETETVEVFTKNLSNSIHGVLLGDYDVGSMCGVNYELMNVKIHTGELKVIADSDDYPENVVGARVNLPANQIQAFQSVLLNMANNAEGMALLKSMRSMKIKNFVPYDDSMENITKKMLEASNL